MFRAIFPALVLLAVANTMAEARYACAVKRTADGFVALREGPSTRHPIVGRMKEHEMVDIMHPETQDRKLSGNWIWGSWHPGTRWTGDKMPARNPAKSRDGWVYSGLLECFVE